MHVGSYIVVSTNFPSLSKQYQRWIWDAFVAISETTKTDSGFSSISDVNAAKGGSKTDSQPSFFFAETLKYTYLAFSDGMLFP